MLSELFPPRHLLFSLYAGCWHFICKYCLLFLMHVQLLTFMVFLMQDTGIGTATSLYLLCCILRIVKIKDLANIVAVALLCDIETFVPTSEAKLNGFMDNHGMSHEDQDSENGGFRSDSDGQTLRVLIPNISSSLNGHPEDDVPQPDHGSSHSALWYFTFHFLFLIICCFVRCYQFVRCMRRTKVYL